MTTPMKIITLVVIPVVVLAIGLGIFLAVSNGDSGDDPVETLPPVESVLAIAPESRQNALAASLW